MSALTRKQKFEKLTLLVSYTGPASVANFRNLQSLVILGDRVHDQGQLTDGHVLILTPKSISALSTLKHLRELVSAVCKLKM